MKVLIISQPVLSKTNNMGKTLMGTLEIFLQTIYLSYICTKVYLKIQMFVKNIIAFQILMQ